MKRIASVLLFIALATSTTFGSLYLWNPNKRTPVSLQKALVIAENVLGEDAKNRYCISVMLYGNKAQDGTVGNWNLLFAAEDGSQKMVLVDEKGKGSVTDWNAPIDWRNQPKARSGLAEIAELMNIALADRGYKERAIVDGDKLTLRARTRSFQIHKRIEDGEFSNELEKVLGPKKDGIIVEARLTDRIERESHQIFGPYWIAHQATYRLTGKDRFVRVSVKYGNDNSFPSGKDKDIVLPILKSLGEQASESIF